jgi:hypothetical protein
MGCFVLCLSWSLQLPSACRAPACLLCRRRRRQIRASVFVRQTVPAVQKANPLRESDIPAAALNQIKAGLAESSRRANEPPRNKLPLEAQRMRTWVLGQVRHAVAAVKAVENEELALLRAERAKGDYPLGDLPLVVLTRGISEDDGPAGRSFEEEHRRDHAAVAALSKKGKLVVAARGGHHVQLDEPELVISTIKGNLR